MSQIGRDGTGVAPAVRARTPGWRDPRLWVGVLLVVGSVVAGSRVLASADDTVAVWAAGSDLAPGQPLDQADLVARDVRFADGADLATYVAVADDLPADLTLVRGVGAGELLPWAATGDGAGSDTVEVPIAVDPEQVPSSVGAGSVVDVYLVGAAGARGAPAAGPALAEVTVLDAQTPDEGFGVSGKRRLVLAVPEEGAADFFALLGSLDTPVITVVRRG